MIVLGSATEVLRARLAIAPTTTNPTFSFAWGDDSAAPALGNTRGALNGTTNANLVDAPAAGAVRVVRSGYIYNGDSAAVTVLIEHYDGTNARQLARITLQPKYVLTLADCGLRVTDENGGDIGVAGPIGPQGDVGPQGTQGPSGAPGQIRFTGQGAPPLVIPGATAGDTYMDLLTGLTYKPT